MNAFALSSRARAVRVVERSIASTGIDFHGKPVIAAVSGGADSTFLACCLAALQRRFRFKVSIGHVNHGWRPEASAEDARFVACLGERLGLPVHVLAMAENDGSSSMTGGPEASARQGRYQFLANLALATGSAAIMTGHTADDQVETAFMAMMRGRGPGSVAGMTMVSLVPHSPPTTSMVVHDPEVLDGDRTSPFGAVLVRPMLGLSATVVRTALGDAGIDWREDATNDDLRHPRNRLRHRVLPELEAISPGFRDAFLRSLAITREMAEIAKKAVDDAAANWIPAERGVQMPTRTLLGYTPFAQSALIRSALVRLGADPERIEASHLHAATEMVARGRGRAHLEFADGYRVEVIKGSAVITQVGRSSPGVDGSDLPHVVVNPAP